MATGMSRQPRAIRPYNTPYNTRNFLKLLRSHRETLIILNETCDKRGDVISSIVVVCEMKFCENVDDAKEKAEHFEVLKERRGPTLVYMYIDPYPKVFEFRVDSLEEYGDTYMYESENYQKEYSCISLRFSKMAVERIHLAIEEILGVNLDKPDEYAEFPYGCVVKLKNDCNKCYVNISHAESVVYLLLVELQHNGKYVFPFRTYRKESVQKLMQRVDGRDIPLIISYEKKKVLLSHVRRLYLDPTDPVQTTGKNCKNGHVPFYKMV